jgi:cytochrome c
MMAMLVGWTGAAWADGDPAAGKTVFEGECAPCHSLDKATQLAGPSLIGVVGRKSGALDDYDYSMAMLGADKTWDAGTLDAYLTNPQAIVPGTKMPYPGLASAVARQNLIAYLATVHE